jgi:flagellum-specific peptidoglycan hydrolase FlgJ|tara:strand:- start:923 stop:1684 length:762 start_codon:yes stop_codon:yes gene_type:complete
MKKVLIYLIILILTFSCGTKRVIYNNKTEEPKKEVKSKKKKSKKKKPKEVVIVPKILNTEDYVKFYSNIAMDEMIQFGIPASITLAQGILESGAGKGRLAVQANNHFGIKCHDWNGKKIYHDDDEEQECFRKYDNPEYSYRDHSLFLTNRGRYSFLFDLKKDDYKQWAKGLKKAGYATDPKYPQKLIDLIQRYQLYKYDNIVLKKKNKPYKVKKGDTLFSISEKFNMPIDAIIELNDLKGNNLSIGQVIMIKK